MTARCPALVIAGTGSGVGKTSLSLAIVAALRRKGLCVQTFKVGPDFLDPSYLSLASGRPCYNLDGWMTGEAYVRTLYARAVAGADVALVEGAMGLFDGADPASSEGSTAEIARWLCAPVLLVLDAGGMSRSAAAMVKGFAGFEAGVNVAAVVANRCGSERHASWLAESLRGASLPPLVGGIPRGAFPVLRSRHLGLATADRRILTEEVLGAFVGALEKGLPTEELMKLMRRSGPVTGAAASSDLPGRERNVRIGVAWDEAFHFYYPDNLDALEAAGAELVRFSPIRDDRLPEGLGGLYLGGGYPEEHAEALSGNGPMKEAVRRFAEAGHPVYAECGGLMYLAEGVERRDGVRHPFLGLLPSWARMLDRPKRLGYAEVTLTKDTLLGRRGETLRGHEFHYSELAGDPPARSGWNTAYLLTDRRAGGEVKEGYGRGRVLASYVHLHFASRPGCVERFLSLCEEDHGE